MFSKQSLERLTDIRDALSDVSLRCGSSPWKGVSEGAMSLAEGEGPWRGEGRALNAAKVPAQAPVHTVSCDREPVYAQ